MQRGPVAYLHERGVIHKAINSNNFLLVDGVLKVSDYGMEAAVSIQKASGGLPARVDRRSNVSLIFSPGSILSFSFFFS